MGSIVTHLAQRLRTAKRTDPVLQHACACGGHSPAGGECESCRKKREAREGKLQRAAVNEADVTEVPEIVYDVLRSSGQPLDRDTRAFMEPRFGHDFGGVRIHTDSRAAESAAAVNALAYTVGRDVVFGEGQYAPGSGEGQRLLAHELTHVVQQGSGDTHFQGKLTVRATNDVYEQEAEHNSNSLGDQPATFGFSLNPIGIIQRAAPAAALVGIGALAAKCITGAIIGAVLDLAIQSGMHMWRNRRWGFQGMIIDYCSLILSAVLSCIGGMVALKWLEPWLARVLGTRLGGISGTLLGRILMFIANRFAIGLPRAIIKKLLMWGCISDEQAEALAPGVSNEAIADSSEPEGGSEGTALA